MGVREAVRAGAASVHGLTLAVLAVGVAEALVRHRGTQLLIALAFAVALNIPLSLRRRAPIATVVWVVAVMAAASTFPISQDVFVVALVVAGRCRTPLSCAADLRGPCHSQRRARRPGGA